MLLSEARQGNVIVAALESDRLTGDVAGEFKSQLQSYFEQGNCIVILDFSNVRFMDSSGLGVLVSTLKKVTNDSALIICGVGGVVASMFKLTRMDKVFRIFPTVKEAITSLNDSN